VASEAVSQVGRYASDSLATSPRERIWRMTMGSSGALRPWAGRVDGCRSPQVLVRPAQASSGRSSIGISRDE
jgi:hypothetical protein